MTQRIVEIGEKVHNQEQSGHEYLQNNVKVSIIKYKKFKKLFSQCSIFVDIILRK